MLSAVLSLSRAFILKPFRWLDRSGAFLRSVVSFAVVPAVTWLAFQAHLNLTATSLLQLLAVLAIALRIGFWPAALASVFANLCLNYFFVPPLFSLYIADPQNWIASGRLRNLGAHCESPFHASAAGSHASQNQRKGN